MFNPVRCLLTAIFLLFFLSGLAAMGAIPGSQREALIALYNSTNGDSWGHSDGWKTPPLAADGFALPGTEGTWYGVTVEADNVTWISLGGNGLSGTIPTVLAGLPALQVLNLGSNQLSGSIPSELGNLANLQQLYLSYNQLTGSIPAALGNLTGLTHLYLPNNLLTGSIPVELGGLTNLQQLRLSSNLLSGSIPASLGSLVNLRYLYLDSNGTLSGAIPPELGNLEELIDLFLYSNQLTGSIPPELGNLTKLQRVWLTNNQLSGEIPSSLGGMTALRDLQFGGNLLSGPIPASFGNLTNLTSLALYVNHLTGPIPAELGNLTNLTSLFLSSNQLSGAIPPALANLTNLTNLNLTGNDLTGQIPTELGSLIRLNTLDLRYNRLSGTISSALGSLTGLRYLYLNGNTLAGPVPTSLMNLTLLSYADFGYNALYTSDAALIAFLNSKDPDWASTQTIAPTGVTAEAVDGAAVLVSWTPIPYTANIGYYKIYHAQAAGGPYGLAGQTADKSVSSFEVSGLNHGQPYYFVVQTHTDPHQNNWYKNHVESEYSAEVSATPWLQVDIRVAGTILAGGSPLANVVMAGLPGDPATDSSGGYDVTVAAGWSGTVTPTLLDYTFSPASRTYTAVTEDQLAQDYAGTAVVIPAISITAPNGGETWPAGSTHNITWTPVSMTGSATIDLYKGGVYHKTLGTPDVTVGVFSWIISPGEPAGADYRVRVWQGSVSDDSDADFAIARHPKRVDFNRDGQEDVLWRYYGPGGYVRAWFLGDMGEGAGPLTAIEAPPAEALPGTRGSANDWTLGSPIRNPQDAGGISIRSKIPPVKDPREVMSPSGRQAWDKATVDDPRSVRRDDFDLKILPKPLSVAGPAQVRYALDLQNPSNEPPLAASTPYLLGGADLLPVDDLHWWIVGMEDFNNDTHVDILWRHMDSGSNVVWFMNETTWIGSALLLGVSDLAWEIVGTGDFNNDTHPDILWRNAADGANVVWYMNGTNWIDSAVLLGVSDLAWEIAGTGDFNNDGHVDILWRYNQFGGHNVVWYMNDANWIGSAELISVEDLSWEIACTGDYNNDGKVDILWRYQWTGSPCIWYMDGVTWNGSGELLQVPDTTWKLVPGSRIW